MGNFPQRFRIFSSGILAAILLCATVLCGVGFAQQAATAQLSVDGDVPTPLSLTLEDLRHQPRSTLNATNQHQGSEKEVYEGVLLSTLLKQAGVPQGSQIKGAALATRPTSSPKARMGIA